MIVSKAEQTELDLLLLVKDVLYRDFNHALYIALCYLKYREQQYGESCLSINEIKEILRKGKKPCFTMRTGFDDDSKQCQSTPPKMLKAIKRAASKYHQTDA